MNVFKHISKLILLSLVFLSFSCNDESTKKAENILTPACVIVNSVTTASWDTMNKPVEKQVQCIEGHLVRQDDTTAYPDCSGAIGVDIEKKYFQYFKDGKCPKENVLAKCETKTGSIYLYQSEFNNDVNFFRLYCTHFMGEIK